MSIVCIVDIDTTIANNDHRALHLVMGEDGRYTIESWNTFLRHDLMHQDSAQKHAKDVLDHMRSLKYRIVFLTGRNERFREVTALWLASHMGKTESELLLMRNPSNADIPASDYKEEEFLRFKKSNMNLFDTYLFFEDDKHVMQMWKKYGLVFQCPEAWASLDPQPVTEQETPWCK